jgi:hypothetical protein
MNTRPPLARAAERPLLLPQDAADVARLCAWFDAGALVRPDAARPNLVDLVRALARCADAEPPLACGANAARLAELIGRHEHLVFVLVDGMGARMLELLREDAFLRTHAVENLLTVFPATTAAALTSHATGVWPSEHGIYGWWMRFPEIGRSATVLPYVERFSEEPLEKLGLGPERAFAVPSMVPRFGKEPIAVLPDYIVESVYSRYATGGTPRRGYAELRDGASLVARLIADAARPTYVYFYLPQLDSLCHEYGVGRDRAGKLLAVIDAELAGLRARLPATARLVIAADHGLVDLPPEREFVLRPADPLLGFLKNEPVGDPCVPIFHVKPGAHAAFARAFRARFGATHVLLPMAEVERLRLFGPDPFSDAMRARIGDYLALTDTTAVLAFLPDGESPGHLRGVHAGLSPAEMEIPLVVA